MKQIKFMMFVMAFICFNTIQSVYATDFTFDGIRYNIIDEEKKTVEVAALNNLSGNISIPSIVSHEGQNYTVTAIGNQAFENCNELTSIILSDSLTIIGSEAFKNCSSLLSITLPYSLTTIEDKAFYRCYSLENVTFHKNITNIGALAFGACRKIKSVYIDDIVSWFRIHFEYNTNIIDSSAGTGSVNPLFYGGNLYVNGELLTRLSIPSDITQLKYTFSGCSNTIEEVKCNAVNPPTIIGWEFNDYTIPLYVPKGSVLNYKAANVWRNFVIIREIDGEQDAYLSVNQSNGVVMMKVDREKPYFSLQIKADDGWRIHSVTFNGNDVTAEVSAEGNYTTPAITTNSTLYVIYEKVGSGIVSLSESRMRVLAYGNNITIKDALEGERIVVYSVDGREISAAIADSHGIVKMALPENQTYIVKGQTKTVKVRL